MDDKKDKNQERVFIDRKIGDSIGRNVPQVNTVAQED
ncbi:MAG: hypothetical protein BWX71_02800 [Deltaproteobacteria bacterium ADurb.Bin072]|nr:MAG: hypothetical protein BWX71_02800 [Deltaproteobacteria bacterium ADurb.Bin072]